MTQERDFLKQVVQLAQMYGWLATSVNKSARQVHGRWISNLTGNAGEPDLRMVRPPRYICAELKVGSRERNAKGHIAGGTYGLTAEQKRWHEALEKCPGVEVYTWTPGQLDEIERILRP